MRAAFRIESTAGDARTGTVTTARGSFATPCFMPVGTRGAVKHLDSSDLEALGVEVVLANTYHLMLRPGSETVARLGGIHGFARWGVSLSCCQVFLGGLGQVLRLGCLVGGLGFEHGEDDVAAASGDADHGGVVAFAL